MLKIVADENIPLARQLFSLLGEVISLPGRAITAQTLSRADVLLVRSVTKVDSQLLKGTSVRFVGTATIGTDHIDLDYLNHAGIAFSDAAGCNANSVAEYVVTALLRLAEQNHWSLAGKTLGIIGVGNIGSKVEKYARILGMQPLPNDPPLQQTTCDRRFVGLAEALSAEIITLHVPLTRTGPEATYHLLDEAKLRQLQPQSILINTSRGPVVDNQALKQHLQAGKLGSTVLDVWENEPNIDLQLLEQVAIGTAHIAGYSLNGKVNATLMLHDALCDFLKVTDTAHVQDFMDQPAVPQINLKTTDRPDQQLLTEAFTGIYDILRDDADLRQITQQPPDRHGDYFDQLRRNYPVRTEAHNTTVILEPYRISLAEKLTGLGFNVSGDNP